MRAVSPFRCHRIAFLACVLVPVLAGPAAPPAAAQAIDRDAYLTYVPLEYPPLVARPRANVDFALFGDPAAPGFIDVDPRDGIDDRRGRRLHELAARFGPIMVANTTNLPMDFRRFMADSRSFNLYVDTWSLAGGAPARVRSREIALGDIVDAPCGDTAAAEHDPAGDCLLLDLLERYHPEHPDWPRLAPRVVDADENFEVMFFDFPGEDPETWKAEFENEFSRLLPERYHDYLKVFMHPFIQEHRTGPRAEPRYELVLQYYFFYPTNDGGNDHEGDWEHINVSVTPHGSHDRLLRAAELQTILDGTGDDNELVIRYIDYYFHHQVYRMDFTRPDAYAAREAWERQVEDIAPELYNERRTWRAIRRVAWWDDKETVVNTHPICYIGADNKGLDQLLSPPGGTNRDSHGTYPFTGLYKDIGPGGATEQINAFFDGRKWYRRHGGDVSGSDQQKFGRGHAVPYTTRKRIEVVPDWECVLEPVLTDVEMRRDWFWLLLPVRWGYPATQSPFAGVVAHAETGNLSPFGPNSQPHWNRVGGDGGSHRYEPHSFETLFPLGLQDSFVNSWGYLNLTLPVIASVPPIDFAWRLVAYPFRRALQRNDPVFFPTEKIPSRLVGLTAGFSRSQFNEEVALLVLNGDPGIEQLVMFAITEPDGLVSAAADVPPAEHWWWQISFYLGDRFSTQNTLLHSRSDLRINAVGRTGTSHTAATELNLWEYAGSFRYDLTGRALRPFLKLGYGWTWYRAENGRFDGIPLTSPDGRWLSQPSFDSLGDLLPSSWHWGAGLELVSYRSGAPFPGGIDFSLVAEATRTHASLDVDTWLLIDQSSNNFQDSVIQQVGMDRWTFSLGLTMGL
ncbi:hypothetical protein KDM41_06025 [bacterium]|nr:hypothetical protein [bacterium]